MRKFIVHTRPLPGLKGDGPFIVEVEGEVISAIEDPSIMWLPNGEFKFRILLPKSLHEPQDKVMVPPVYHSHSIFSTLALAHVRADKMIREQFEFVQRKTGATFTEEQVREQCAAIQEIRLP